MAAPPASPFRLVEALHEAGHLVHVDNAHRDLGRVDDLVRRPYDGALHILRDADDIVQEGGDVVVDADGVRLQGLGESAVADAIGIGDDGVGEIARRAERAAVTRRGEATLQKAHAEKQVL